MTPLEHTPSQTQAPWSNFPEFVSDWCRQVREEMRQKLESIVQEAIDEVEKGRTGVHERRQTHYHTPLGTIKVQRRIYQGEDSPVCWSDQALGLPADAWLPEVAEIACALGVGSEFPNATRLFTRWTGVGVSEHGLANRVEAAGALLAAVEAQAEPPPTAPMDSALARQVRPKTAKPRVYVGADGTMVPRNEGQKYNEARVGVVFWAKNIRQVSETRREIREKQYVATMQDVSTFAELLFKQYGRVVGEEPCEAIFLGDGALWIWNMASEYYPEGIQILDFYHVSEYIGDVARATFPDNEVERQRWSREQKDRLKASKHADVIASLEVLDQSTNEIRDACTALKRYLKNNESRIDYKSYLAKGYYIGSGVVESSNRKVVTQRVNQAGMHWSLAGVDAMISLRAAYCSSGDRWQSFWDKRSTPEPLSKPKKPLQSPHRKAAKPRVAS